MSDPDELCIWCCRKGWIFKHGGERWACSYCGVVTIGNKKVGQIPIPKDPNDEVEKK